VPNELSFSKDRAKQIFDCIAHSQPIPPAGAKWEADDVLMLAGTCQAAAVWHSMVETMGKDFPHEVAGPWDVVRIYSKLAMEVFNGEYDERHRLTSITGVFFIDADGQKAFKITEGAREPIELN
jgi:hypothetical protein